MVSNKYIAAIKSYLKLKIKWNKKPFYMDNNLLKEETKTFQSHISAT